MARLRNMKHISDGIPKIRATTFSKDDGNTSRVYNRLYEIGSNRSFSPLPLYTVFLLYSNFKKDTWYSHINYESCAVEIPLEGNLRLIQAERSIIISPGTGYIIHKGSDCILETGPAGFCRKVSVAFDGELLLPLLIKLRLIEKTDFQLKNLPECKKLIEKLKLCSECRSASEIFEMSALTYRLILELAGEITETQPENLAKALSIMKQNIPNAITIKGIAAELKISQMTLNRLFLHHLKKSPKQYFLEQKIQKACALLKNTCLPVKAIAEQIGYKDSAQFIREFRKAMACTPRKYRTEKQKKFISF